MIKSATIYSVPGCPRCISTKKSLEALGYAIEERDGEALARGEIYDLEALVELNVTDTYPVVVIGGVAVAEGSELYNQIQEAMEKQ